MSEAPKDIPTRMPEDMFDDMSGMSKGMSERMSEDCFQSVCEVESNSYAFQEMSCMSTLTWAVFKCHGGDHSKQIFKISSCG